jgi:hypothetical protein
MTHHRILTGVTTALLGMIAMGCAGPTDSSVRLADATASTSPVNTLCGTWSGFYWYVAGDHMSQSGNALTLQIDADSNYTFRWGNRPPITGKVVFQSDRVILQDAAGSDLAFARRSGGALYGVTRDSANGRPTMMSLDKQESIVGPFAASGPACS